MKPKTIISNFAILTVMFAYASNDAYAGVRIGNKSRTYADAYNQVNEMSNPRVGVVTHSASVDDIQNSTTATAAPNDAQESLPIRVANAALAQRIARGDETVGVTVNDLERCSMVYPGGEFAWDKPTAGLGRGTREKCVAVVEMRAVGAAADGSDLVLARANVASGDSVRCNISEFPEIDYTNAAYEFTFPADNPPTMDDVKKVLDAEQKQNAGFKIAASAVVGALGGNMVGKNDVGNENLLGTDKGKIEGSVIGALAGAAIGAGNAYGGKVGGDVIMSTGINAAAGGIMGNVLATGDSVLRIEPCEVDGLHTTCLWGYVMDSTLVKMEDYVLFFNLTDDSTVYACPRNSAVPNDPTKPVVTANKCKTGNYVNIVLDKYPNKDLHEAAATNYNLIYEDDNAQYHLETDENGDTKMVQGAKSDGDIYALVRSAGNVGKQYPAMIPEFKDSAFGLKSSDWNKLRKTAKAPIGRGAKGKATDASKSYDIKNFFPIYRSSDDGGIVDFGNKARLKATVTGAGVGGALGAFSGYQGAQNDISDRWLSASREYEDSLGKVYCITGSRYLTRYNDVVTILEMP